MFDTNEHSKVAFNVRQEYSALCGERGESLRELQRVQYLPSSYTLLLCYLFLVAPVGA